MSANLPSLYAQQFATNVQLLLQQKGSRLRKAVTEGNYKGEQASPVDQVGKVEMQPVTTRFSPMTRVDAPVDRRWVLPTPFDLPQLVDTFDLLKMAVDVKSTYTQNAVNAAGRQWDRTLLTAMFGTNQTGKTGSTGTTFTAGNIVAVNEGSAGNVNMNVAKLRKAKKLLMGYDVNVDEDPLWCAINASQHDALLQEATVISTDFNDRPVLVDGKLMRFMGFNFIHTELLNNNATPYRMVPAWARSGVHLGIWGEDMKVEISQRNDLTAVPWQIYLYMMTGATRLEENKVIQILCNEA